MSVEKITLAKFESALLPTKAEKLGLIQSEYCYFRPIDSNPKFGVYVRSSIGPSQICDETGKDSIRVYLAKRENNQIELVGFAGHWLTRASGWESRLIERMREIYKAFLQGDFHKCDICGNPLKINKVKKAGANHGRMFGTCASHPKTFKWLGDKK